MTFQELDSIIQELIALITVTGGSKENQAALLHSAETQFAVAKREVHVAIAEAVDAMYEEEE